MAETGGFVAAGDRRVSRVSLLDTNRRRLQIDNLAPLVADGRQPPFPPGTFDRVLLDAPCSGLGALRRRPDARWRVDESDIDRLVGVQCELVDGLVDVVRPGGMFVYSVCTLTRAETLMVDEYIETDAPAARRPAVTACTVDAARARGVAPAAGGRNRRDVHPALAGTRVASAPCTTSTPPVCRRRS